jgi:putative endonuclease
MTARTQALGAYGERAAVRHLVATGLRILDRNWRCRACELGIVALDPQPTARSSPSARARIVRRLRSSSSPWCEPARSAALRPQGTN